MNDSPSTIKNFYTHHSLVKLVGASISDDGLIVNFEEPENKLRSTHQYPWLWVRDHCIDSRSLDQRTTQRIVDTFDLNTGLVCTNIEVDESNQILHLDWNTQETSSISAYILASVVSLTPEQHQLSPQKPRVLWNKDAPLSHTPTVDFEDVIENEEGLLHWLENIQIYGFCLVNNVPASEQGTKQLAHRIGMVQETIFGGFWPLSSELKEHGDSAYSDSYLEPHTDGTYYHDAAGLQMFNCLDIDCKGGESIQVDGFAIANTIKQEDPEAYRILCEVSIPGHYIDQGIHLRAQRPAIQTDKDGELVQVSFNNYDRAPMLLEKSVQEQFYEAYKLLHRHVTDQNNWIKIDMKAGTALIFDNWRNLHGRMGFSGRRYFYGCYHSRATFESRLRTLQSLY